MIVNEAVTVAASRRATSEITRHGRRRHAKIVSQGNQFFIEDLGSANGTFINGSVRLAQGRPYVLVSGDELKLGETTLKFVVS